MIPQIEYSDFPVICRLCMHKGVFINILDRPDLIYVYVSITKTTIKHDDIFPKNVCQDCIDKLEIVKDFIQICKSSYEYLTAVILKQDYKEMIFPNIVKKVGNISTNNASELQETSENENSGMDQDDIESTVLENIKLQIQRNNIKSIKKKFNRECTKCKRIFHSINSFKIHMKNHCNKINTYKPGRKKQYSLKSIKSSNENDNFNKMPIDNTKLKKGMKWRCLECNKEFTKKNDLQRHLRIHTGSRPFVCSICDLKFTQKSTLNRHIGAIHIIDEKEKYNFECYICEKKFNRKDHLESHMINCHIKKIDECFVDNPDEKVCKECGKSFSLFSYTKHHTSIHCVKEGKDLIIKKSRSKHPPSSSNLCSVCGKSFERRATYLQHMRRSHGPPLPKKTNEIKSEKKKDNSQHQRFQCWQCGKIQSTLSNLKVHMRIHTGEKPYECKFCFRKFSAWNSWHDHENIHLGVKPYQCDYCKKVFGQRSSLRKHLRSSLHVNQNKTNEEKLFK